MATTTPARRRQVSNDELLSSIATDGGDRSTSDDSKSRRHMHLELGPIVISGAALDRVRARIFSFTSKINIHTLRPLPVFLGVTGPSFCIGADAFSPPISFSSEKTINKHEKCTSRISRNLAYFATNYTIMALGTVLVVALMHPGMLFYVGITWGLWWLHLVVLREDIKLVVMEKDLNEVLSPNRRSWVFYVWTFYVAVAKCLHPSLKGLAISGALVLFHAIMRNPAKLASDMVRSKSIASGAGDSDDDSKVMVQHSDAV
eukprot:scaffold3846_cov127-Skeletonema_dohrnii-CCMP3373.AAC.10